MIEVIEIEMEIEIEVEIEVPVGGWGVEGAFPTHGLGRWALCRVTVPSVSLALNLGFSLGESSKSSQTFVSICLTWVGMGLSRFPYRNNCF